MVVNAPGWPVVQQSFFNAEVFAESWPLILEAFWINIQLFLIAELLILPSASLIAVLRSRPGPVFLPSGSSRPSTWTSSGRSRASSSSSSSGSGSRRWVSPGVPNDPFFYGGRSP